MLPYKPLPMFQIGPVHFNMYGIMFALAILTATFLAMREAKKRGIDKNTIYDLVFELLIGIIIGSRLFYVLFYWPANVPFHFLDIFKIWQGGLAFFGGLLGGLAAGLFFIKRRKLNFWIYADIFTIPLVVGHIIGRLGGYLVGEHPGLPTTLPWGIYFQGAIRHPVLLYEIIGLIIIAFILLKLKKQTPLFAKGGVLFASYIALYSMQRMVLDFFRIESTDPRFLGLTPSQYLVIILFAAAVWFLWLNAKTPGFASKHKNTDRSRFK